MAGCRLLQNVEDFPTHALSEWTGIMPMSFIRPKVGENGTSQEQCDKVNFRCTLIIWLRLSAIGCLSHAMNAANNGRIEIASSPQNDRQGHIMLITSVADAFNSLAEIRFPVIMIALHNDEVVGCHKIGAREAYIEAANTMMSLSPCMTVVVTSASGDAPTRINL